jgi:hypothetical protein
LVVGRDLYCSRAGLHYLRFDDQVMRIKRYQIKKSEPEPYH